MPSSPPLFRAPSQSFIDFLAGKTIPPGASAASAPCRAFPSFCSNPPTRCATFLLAPLSSPFLLRSVICNFACAPDRGTCDGSANCSQRLLLKSIRLFWHRSIRQGIRPLSPSFEQLHAASYRWRAYYEKSLEAFPPGDCSFFQAL